MKGYGQFCPIALAAEVLGERWTFLVIRELAAGTHRFNELRRGVPLMSPSLLTQRLRTLEQAGIVDRQEVSGQQGAEYHLTKAGKELEPLLEQMGAWGAQWARAPGPEDLDPGLLIWDIHRRLDLDSIPVDQCVVLFEFDDAPKGQGQYWMIRSGDDVDVCLRNPGHEVDLRVASTVETLTDVWTGRRPVRAAIRARDIRLEGDAALKRTFPSWLLLSVFAEA